MLNGISLRNSVLQIFLSTYYTPGSTIRSLSTEETGLMKQNYLEYTLEQQQQKTPHSKNQSEIGF